MTNTNLIFTAIDAGNLADWDAALFEVLLEERWRAAAVAKPHAYLMRACNSQIEGRDTDPLKRQAAKDDDAWLPASEPVSEFRIEDFEPFFASLGFDDDMRAYLKGRSKGITRTVMASYLTAATGEAWDDLRVERARKRFERAKPRMAELYRGRATASPGDWQCYAPAGGEEPDCYDLPTLSDVQNALVAGDDYGPADLRQSNRLGPHFPTCSASTAHHKQRLWVTEPGQGQRFVFAHKWDRGHGTMDPEGMEAFREMLADERADLFRIDEGLRCPTCGRTTCGLKLSALSLLAGMAERRVEMRWAVEAERIVSGGKKAKSLKTREK